MESGDLSADLLADLEQGANGLPQKTLPAKQLFGPPTEDIAARRSVSYAKMPVMTPNANTPNVMLVTPMKTYFMSKVATPAAMTLVMARSIDTRSKAWPWPAYVQW